MKIDPDMHIGLHLVFFGKTGVTARAARRRSTRAWRESWPERRRRQGAEGPAVPGGTGAGTPIAGMVGTGPG
jgi:hypothetical protein